MTPSTETTLTPDRILEAAEETLRRFGPAKTTVVDVSRALGVSHGSVYRHFASKADLRDAVAARWLARIHDPLEVYAGQVGQAQERLRAWMDALIAAKRQRALEDPELFATYVALAVQARGVVTAHKEALRGQLARIVADGVTQGAFRTKDPEAAAHAIFDATARFHHPAHAGEWSDPQIDQDFEDVWALLIAGLRGP